jgi:hypothetical protein
MSKKVENSTPAAITEEQSHHNPILSMQVEKDSELKEYLVEYVGTKLDKEEVTVNMVAEILATEFPEFVYAMAEENFIRGYELGLEDAEKLYSTETTPNS